MTWPPRLRIRPARTEDGGTAQALAEAAFAHYVDRIGRRPAPMDLDYAAIFGRGGSFLAEKDDAVLGFVVTAVHPDHLLLDVIAVSPAAQGAGVGTRLLEFVDERAGRLGLDEVRLLTNQAMTENLAWYPRHGYVETHRTEDEGFQRVFFRKRL